MIFSRRSFLVRAGGLVTASLVREAQAYAADTGSPLILAPPKPKVELYYEWVQDSERGGLNALLHLGPPQVEPPPPPLWIDHLRETGHLLETPADIEVWCASSGMEPEDLFEPVPDWGWESYWGRAGSPTAKAVAFLQRPELLPGTRGFERAGQLMFHNSPNPMNDDHWVEARDALSLSLLQARFNELGGEVILRAADLS
jgi:hypothetical protein